MSRREAGIDDVPITEAERRIRGPRGADEEDTPLPLW
ncbi:hypothetical protein CJ469_02091 [Nocardia farcinica]|nr:hypothetical protein CJ469_02091 [Nocardia farcinica]PFX06575.1 hypothetical protein CJ468_04503 [Nocardia farcinica]VFA91725.1 Uncharacterised protein [Nocardia farcinica]